MIIIEMKIRKYGKHLVTINNLLKDYINIAKNQIIDIKERHNIILEADREISGSFINKINEYIKEIRKVINYIKVLTAGL